MPHPLGFCSRKRNARSRGDKKHKNNKNSLNRQHKWAGRTYIMIKAQETIKFRKIMFCDSPVAVTSFLIDSDDAWRNLSNWAALLAIGALHPSLFHSCRLNSRQRRDESTRTSQYCCPPVFHIMLLKISSLPVCVLYERKRWVSEDFGQASTEILRYPYPMTCETAGTKQQNACVVLLLSLLHSRSGYQYLYLCPRLARALLLAWN